MKIYIYQMLRALFFNRRLQVNCAFIPKLKFNFI